MRPIQAYFAPCQYARISLRSVNAETRNPAMTAQKADVMPAKLKGVAAITNATSAPNLEVAGNGGPD
jgi:hypothetical protein